MLFLVLIFLEAYPGHRASLREALLQNARYARENEPGCLAFDVAEDPVDQNAFLLYEVYRDPAAHRAHLELPRYAEYRLLVDPWIKSRRVLTYNIIKGGTDGG